MAAHNWHDLCERERTEVCEIQHVGKKLEGTRSSSVEGRGVNLIAYAGGKLIVPDQLLR